MRFSPKPATPLRDEQECLEGFEALIAEMRRAILAIANNDPAALEASLGRQAQTRGTLQAALLRFERTAPYAPLAKTRILRSARELAALNEEYAALVAHSGDSLRLLAALHGAMQQGERAGNSWQA